MGLKETKNLFKWEGKKEIFWIVFIIFVLFISWAYNRDMEVCRENIERTDDLWFNITGGTGVVTCNCPTMPIPQYAFTTSPNISIGNDIGDE